MKKLEDKILKKIYKIETRRTFEQILSKSILIILLSISSIFIFSIIVEILNEQASFDLFDFLRDDFEMVQTFIFNNITLFIQELPLPLVYILLGLIFLLIWIIFILIKNINKIKNKLFSFYKFWFK